MKGIFLNIKKFLLLLLFLGLLLYSASALKADIFYYSWEYNSLYNEKIALELELKSLKKQFKNEVSSLEARIRDLENNIDNLNNKIELLQKGRDEDNRLSERRIKELEKVRDILKRKSSDREKELINENKRLQNQCKETIDKLRDDFQKEREAHLEEIARLKEQNEKDRTKMQSLVANLSDELESIKKLTKSQRHELDRMATQANDLEKQLSVEIEKGEIRLKRLHEKIIINIDDKICFDTGRAVLKKEILHALDKISAILSDYPENRIHIEGHTDNVPISNKQFRDNWQLSTERSLAVLNYLLKNTKLDPGRFTSMGYGEYQPIVSNDTSENRALNRRVDIVVVPRLKSTK
ncbi:MAG: OmpA family protein [Spirochaetota bacterium]|nr:OmpA family protein [Spirochaetota bacterium]